MPPNLKPMLTPRQAVDRLWPAVRTGLARIDGPAAGDRGIESSTGRSSVQAGHGGSMFGKDRRFSGNDAQGIAGVRNSCFDDPRVKAKATVTAGTTRHLEIVQWTINNAMATEPHFPLWPGFASNELPTEIGKLLAGQDYGADAKKCMELVARIIER
jgi:hypothetical protein